MMNELEFRLTAREVLTLEELLRPRSLGRSPEQEEIAKKLHTWALAIAIVLEGQPHQEGATK